MKIENCENKKYASRVSDLNPGDTFIAFNNELYMKLKSDSYAYISSVKDPCARLSDGQTSYNWTNIEIIPIKYKAVRDEN